MIFAGVFAGLCGGGGGPMGVTVRLAMGIFVLNETRSDTLAKLLVVARSSGRNIRP